MGDMPPFYISICCNCHQTKNQHGKLLILVKEGKIFIVASLLPNQKMKISTAVSTFGRESLKTYTPHILVQVGVHLTNTRGTF